jgi:hypothetical protein
VSLPGDYAVWDPSTGQQQPLGETLELPPVGSVFLVAGEAADSARATGDPVVLDGDWEFAAPDGNALVIDAFADGLRPGAWEFQQPAEPDAEYPFDVEYRIPFTLEYVPEWLDLLIDGFAGSSWSLALNGTPITAVPARSRIDSQMKALDISGALRCGDNELALRLTLTKRTDGLLDRVKLIGDFAVRDGVIVAPAASAAPADWTEQGYPFYSGCGVYRTRVDAALDGLLEADAGDDVLEVLVNGETVGVRLWPPYALAVSLKPGDELELRVFNTPANLLDGEPRRSGLTGPPRVLPWSPSR